MITAISPIDGRYASKVSELAECFSEHALVRTRVRVEVLWLMALCAEGGIPVAIIYAIRPLDVVVIRNHDKWKRKRTDT